MNTIAFDQATLFEALKAIDEALADCEADNSSRAALQLKRVEHLLGSSVKPQKPSATS